MGVVYGNTFSLKWNSLWRNGRRESTKVKNGSELKIKKDTEKSVVKNGKEDDFLGARYGSPCCELEVN